MNVNTTSIASMNTTGFDTFTGDPTMRTLTDDEINTFSYKCSGVDYENMQQPMLTAT